MKPLNKLFLSFGVAGAVAYFGLAILGLMGWVMNIIALFGMFGGQITALFVGRIVGCFFFPLGAVLGWFF